jgi:hypothetical protein
MPIPRKNERKYPPYQDHPIYQLYAKTERIERLKHSIDSNKIANEIIKDMLKK